MTSLYIKHHTAPKPQSEKDRSGQVKNSAGGFSFAVSIWTQLVRFLILGSEGGSYYASERKLTMENADVILACLAEDPARTVKTIVDVSTRGRAPKQGPTLFALAVCMAVEGDTGAALEARRAAFLTLPSVCRTGSHLQELASNLKKMRGFGAGVRRAFGRWYLARTVDNLAYQLVKYRERGGMSHRDILRLARPKLELDEVSRDRPEHAALRWAVGASSEARTVLRKLEVLNPEAKASGRYPRDRVGRAWSDQTWSYPAVGPLPPLIEAFERVKTVKSESEVVKLIVEHQLTHEMVPSEWQGSGAVWEAMLPHMPMTALVRNLGRMTANGCLRELSANTDHVVKVLSDATRIHKARLHPLQILVALKTYESGRGVRGKLVWTPVQAILAALDRAYYLAFDSVVPTEKRHLLAIDVSGSMGFSDIAGMPGISPRVGAAAMAMVTARTEPRYHCVAFSAGRGTEGRDPWASALVEGYKPSWEHGLCSLRMNASMSLADVIAETSSLPFGGTDCALPMLYAIDRELEVDVFSIYTDSETWAGTVHPHVALERYRKASGIDAKLIVVGMISNGFSIANPADPGMLDVVGFDTAVPQVMRDFICEPSG